MKRGEKIYEAIARFIREHFTKMHMWIFLGMYTAFVLLTLGVSMSGSESNRRENQAIDAVVGALSGPFVGSIVRNHQSCCLRMSLAILPYSGCFLLAGMVVQFFPFKSTGNLVRVGMWIIGLVGWFGGGLLSLLHAVG